MATILSFLSGRQITDDNGNPVSGAQLYHFRSGTTTDLTVYQNTAGSTPHAQPVVCDAGGFAPLVYVNDTFAWKVVIKTSGGVTLRTYDALPAATADASSVGFAPPLFQWTQLTSAASPVTLAASDAGKAYEADTTSGSITINLPSAASVGNGKGFVFKKTASANSLIIDPAGVETIDNSSTPLTITRDEQTVGVFSNGAEFYGVMEYGRLVTTPSIQRFTSGAGTYTPTAGTRLIRVRMIGAGGGGGATTTNNGTQGGTSIFGGWSVNGGSGGAAGGGSITTGGSLGTTGTGTLIQRVSGGEGSTFIFVTGSTGGFGGNGVFGGGAASAAASTAGGNGATNSGGGGGGGAGTGNAGGSGGGAGEYVEFFMTAAQIGASQSYSVGAAGAGGAAGSRAGGNGGSGVIIVEEFY